VAHLNALAPAERAVAAGAAKLSRTSSLASDIKLLGYVAAALFFCMAIMLLLTLRQTVRVRGATQWVWSTLTVSVGIGLNTSQEMLPPLLGVVLANVMIIGGAALGACGTFAYRYERMPSLRWLYGGIAVLAVVFAWLVPHFAARILLVAVTTGAICVWHAWLMLAGSKLRPNAAGVKHARFRVPHGVMVLGLLMVAAVFSVRALDTLVSMRSAIPLGGPTRTTFVFYAVGLAGRLFLLIGMVLVLIDELGHQLRTLASRDSLTGLFNRRGLKDAASGRSLVDCSLLMLDLDHFKAVNDDFGHDQGDHVIALLARCAQANLPTNAVLARLGGEEFCALLPQADINAATANAESLRVAFQRDSSALGHTRQHTVSIGVASAQSAATTLSQLMTRADQALYRAKRDGRNRVEMAGAD
jgi:diguanylate cyclase (GGDEF)-like protein